MIRHSRFSINLVTCCLSIAMLAAAAQAAPELNEVRLEGIAPLVEAAIRAKKIPGAVVLIGHDGQVVYRKAFGSALAGAGTSADGGGHDL